MKTVQDQAFDRLLKKLSAMRATLRNEERAILDELIIGQVSTQRMNVGRTTSKFASTAKGESAEVEAHKLNPGKVAPKVSGKVAPKISSKIAEVEAHKLNPGKVAPKVSGKVAPKVSSKIAEVEAHKLNPGKVAPIVTGKVAPKVSSKIAEVEAHKITNKVAGKITNKVASRTAPKIAFDSNSEEYLRIKE